MVIKLPTIEVVFTKPIQDIDSEGFNYLQTLYTGIENKKYCVFYLSIYEFNRFTQNIELSKEHKIHFQERKKSFILQSDPLSDINKIETRIIRD